MIMCDFRFTCTAIATGLLLVGCGYKNEVGTSPHGSTKSGVKTNSETEHIDDVHPETKTTVASHKHQVSETFSDTHSIVFVDGVYARQPVTIRIEANNQVFINGTKVFEHPIASDKVKRYQQLEIPPFPMEITAHSSWADIDKVKVNGKGWAGQFWRYYMSQNEYDIGIKKLTEAYRELPFVANVEIIDASDFGFGPGRKYLKVTSHAGDRRDILTRWYNPDRASDGVYFSLLNPLDFRPYTSEVIKENTNQNFISLKHLVSGNSLVIFSTRNGFIHTSYSKMQKRWYEIVNTVRILNSTLSDKEKATEISDRLVGDPTNSDKLVIDELVKNYKPDEQLNRRIDELEPKATVPLWAPK